MSSLFEGFKFKRKNTIIHNLDPRSKAIYLFITFASALIFVEPIPLLIILSTSIPLIVLAKSLREWSKSMRGLLLFIAFIFILNLLSTPVNRSVFFLTTTPDDFMAALEKLGLPKEYTLMFTMSIRFVPTLARDLQIIIDAQKSRGLELEKGNFIQRVKNYVPILIPLIIYEIRRSIMIAEALEARAFGASKKTTPYIVLKFSLWDYVFSAIVLLFFGLLISMKLLNMLPPWMNIKLPDF
ncbi:MAG: hypothetical protein B6U95_01890 [Thermofilum sp. ex4484_82]|nr:MAG: hypothetical protein B6U95_01890 [Thermofilum sp. ex4484_82]OYT39515.1 MAG: hypothetical protein B6U96_01895 [Archaeoglobales archaeon ex4484_92]